MTGTNRSRAVTERGVERRGPERRDEVDRVVVEEPLEIRIAGDTVSTTMRSPGDDRQLTLGFLYGEGIVRDIDEVSSIHHCGRVGDEGFGNVIDVVPAAHARWEYDAIARARRGTVTTAACGVCGRRTVDDLLARCGVQTSSVRVSATSLASWFAQMRDAQQAFAATGGLHAAAAFRADGSLVALYEDVGRHNAVDKVVGEMLLTRALPARDTVLLVSGRASFEMVQKALAAGFPILASVSAASSLAIDLAVRTGTTLAGFVRGHTMNLYAHGERIT